MLRFRNTLLRVNGDYSRSALLLQQAMLLHNDSTSVELVIKTRHYLGIAMLACGNEISATEHLRKAAALAEDTCWQSFVGWSPADDNLEAYEAATSVYDTACMCFASLIHVLAKTGRHAEALEVAEKAKSFPAQLCGKLAKLSSTTVKEMKLYCKDRGSVLYYSAVSSGHLHRWLITPEGDVLHSECKYVLDKSGGDIVRTLIFGLRQTLGIENSEGENDLSEPEKPAESQTVFSKLLQIQTKYHCHCEHIRTDKGLLLSDDNPKDFNVKSPFYSLYELLFSPFDATLRKYSNTQSPTKLCLVVDSHLALVPFCILKKRPIDHFLSENFYLTTVPSFYALTESPATDRHTSTFRRGLVVGNPLLPASLQDQGYFSSQAADEEANLIGGILRVEPITGRAASKEETLARLENAEVLHFACHLSWSSPAGVVLSSEGQDDEAAGEVDEFSLATPTGEGNSPDGKAATLSDHVLTDSDILALDLTDVKLVVLGSSYLCKTRGTEDHITKLASSATTLAAAFSASGARNLLFSTWPVPETAWKLVAQAFYANLLQGQSTCEALNSAMKSLRDSQQFEHPSYWAGFVLTGPGARLSPRDLSTTSALCSVLQGSGHTAQGAIKLANHLITKSQRRSNASDSNNSVPMYTSQVGGIGKYNS